jgi:hypothetical protein
MLDGWYCRSMVTNTEEDDESHEETINYKSQYRNLKRKLKLLIYVSNTYYCNAVKFVTKMIYNFFIIRILHPNLT